VHIPGTTIYCPQRTDDPPEGLADLLLDDDADAFHVRRQLTISSDWHDRWDTLSHGERKRAQIAVALWSRPLVLALDEPTNHIDRDARQMLISSLLTYRGVGLLVSHDRELLDMLCNQCLFLAPGEARLRSGNYSQASAQAGQDALSLTRQRENARREFVKLKRTATVRRSAAANADRQRSKRHLDRNDHDGRSMLDLARVTGKDAVAGRLLRQMAGRLQHAEEKARTLHAPKTYDLGIWIDGSRSMRDTLFRFPAGRIPLGDTRWLGFPDIAMRSTDHIALTGQNGAGKSTFIRHILNRLDIPAERLIYIPQEIDLQSTRSIMDEVHHLGRDRLGRVMTVVSCLGSRPAQLLESQEPSPGEMRKIVLALGISLEPHLIVMDEPTNHMDLPSIRCMEEAIAGCPCGLVLVSHDNAFLERLTDMRWDIVKDGAGNSRLLL
jgi:ATPase subunit of ABC transporter with duplicated ATPase domains